MKIKVDIEEDNTNDTKIVLNAPLGDNGGVKVALRKLESDSFMFNVTQNQREKLRDVQSASVVVDFDPVENVNVNFTFDNYNDNSQHNLLNITEFYINKIGAPQGVFALLGQGAATSGDLSAANDYETVYSAYPFLSGIQGNNMTLRLEWELDNHTLKLISGNNDFAEVMDICSWGSAGAVVTPNCVFPVVRDQNYDQTSHEIQLISGIYEILPNRRGAEAVQANFEMLGPIKYTKSEDRYAKAIQKETGKPQVGMDGAIHPIKDTMPAQGAVSYTHLTLPTNREV